MFVIANKQTHRIFNGFHLGRIVSSTRDNDGNWNGKQYNAVQSAQDDLNSINEIVENSVYFVNGEYEIIPIEEIENVFIGDEYHRQKEVLKIINKVNKAFRTSVKSIWGNDIKFERGAWFHPTMDTYGYFGRLLNETVWVEIGGIKNVMKFILTFRDKTVIPDFITNKGIVNFADLNSITEKEMVNSITNSLKSFL